MPSGLLYLLLFSLLHFAEVVTKIKSGATQLGAFHQV